MVNGESVATLDANAGRRDRSGHRLPVDRGADPLAPPDRRDIVLPDGSFGAAGVVRVRLTEELTEQAKRRHRNIFSSCSLCGMDLIEAFAEGLPICKKPAGQAPPARHLPASR